MATLEKGKGKRHFGAFAVIPNREVGRDLPPQSLQGPGRRGAGEQGVGALLTGLMTWVEVSQAKEERRKLFALSDAPTVDHGSFLEAVLPKPGWN